MTTNQDRSPYPTLAAWVAAHADEVRGWPASSQPDPPCLVDACERPAHANGLCKTHNIRARRGWVRDRAPRPSGTTEPHTTTQED